MLLREVDRKIKLLDRVGLFHRWPVAVTGQAPVEEMLWQRIYGLALGYEDLNDHEQLRSDPLLGYWRGDENWMVRWRARAR